MRLVKLYIENFGGLNRYERSFDENLTVIQEPNGFGKTTLAEFIRAMFYGFPRKAKTLDKSRRQKYAPWGGGKYGGWLVFEVDGKQYRIERSFGLTPRGDSFSLIDLQTNKKSTRFTDNIGLELFQLDSDSFERSTYLPQLHEQGTLTTDNIQAKLGNLVEDTADVGNYDKAVAALKLERSGCIPYRGSGGTVAEARSRISQLQEDLARTEGMRDQLNRLRTETEQLQLRQEQLKLEKENLHNRMDLAVEAEKIIAAHREKERRCLEIHQMQVRRDSLLSRYPAGIPDEERIRTVRQFASEAAALAAQVVTEPEDLEAESFVEENRSRFEGKLPEREDLEICRGAISDYQALEARQQSIGLSDAEKALYEKLLPLHQSGALDEKRIDGLERTSRELMKLRHEAENARISDGQRQRLEELKIYFAPGIPREEEIADMRQALLDAERLRRERSQPRFLMQDAPRGNFLLPVLLFVLAAAGLGIGSYLVLKGMTAYGMAALVLGAGALIGAVTLLVRRNRQKKVLEQQRRQIAEDFDEKINTLEGSAAEFAARYTLTQPVADALYEIRANREEVKNLGKALAAAAEKCRGLEEEMVSRQRQLDTELGAGDADRKILELRLWKNQFEDLQAEIAETEEKRAAITALMQQRRQQILDCLGLYYDDVQPERFHNLLSELAGSAGRYRRSRERAESWRQRRTRHEEETRRCREGLERFFEEFRLNRAGDLREQLLQIRDDRRDAEQLSRDLDMARQAMQAFEVRNQQLLERDVPEETEDLNQLRLDAWQASEALDAVSEILLSRRQQGRLLEAELARVPDLQDELEQWQEVYTSDRKKAELLDETLLMLEKARENLQSSYLGPVRTAFRDYMQRLLGENGERILLTPDLQVQLERFGQSREMAYFSAGQNDAVMLCMRFALVDALFTGEKPFVILDDPFVNLDDEHTAEALHMLKELAKDRQIVYLVCNSSRSF